MPEPSLPISSRRITQKDVAKHLGLSQATVSMCFANSPRVPIETQQKVRKAAALMGYRPDPMLQSLAIYRGKHKPHQFRSVLGWLTPYQDEKVAKGSFHYESLVGARARAESLGYSVDTVWLKAPGLNARRLKGILSARGIQGILLPPRDQIVAHTDLDWSAHAAVVLGDYSVARPWLDIVAMDHFRSMELALRQLKRLGFKRIGYINEENLDRRLLRGYSSAFLAVRTFSSDVIHREMLTIHVSSHLEIPPQDITRLGKWNEKYKPDVLLYTDVKKRNALLKAIAKTRIRLPSPEFFLCLPAHNPGPRAFSGIDEDWQSLGGHAVEILVAKLQHGNFGLPARPQRTLVEPVWRPEEKS